MANDSSQRCNVNSVEGSLSNDLHPEYIKKSQNSIVRKQPVLFFKILLTYLRLGAGEGENLK